MHFTWTRVCAAVFQWRWQVLYLTRYRNCGSGVVEVIWMVHMFRVDGVTGDTLSYFNVPWGGVRWSNFGSVGVADKATASVTAMTKIVGYGTLTQMTALTATGGFVMFGQQLSPMSSVYTMPTNGTGGVTLAPRTSGVCNESPGHTASSGRTVIVLRLQQTFTVATGEAAMLVLTSSRGGSMVAFGVLHFAWGGNSLYFMPNVTGAAGIALCNSVFASGDNITVAMSLPSVAPADNLVLAFVTGNESVSGFEGTPGWQNSGAQRVRAGRCELGIAGMPRH
jgi:hypothetical protein